VYCINCGAENKDDACFCFGCGTKLTEVKAVNKTNVSEVNESKFYTSLLGKVGPNIVKLEKLEKEYAKCKRDVVTYKPVPVSAQIIIALIMGLGCAGVAFAVLIGLGALGVLGSFIIFILVCGAVMAIFKLFFQQKYETANRRIAEINRDRKLLWEPIYDDVLKYIPQDYVYGIALDRMYGYFVNGRVSSLKEAINLYEEEMHRLRMENMAAVTARAAQQAAVASSCAAFNSAVAAIGSLI